MIDNYKTFGYVRVSTKEQNEARQIEALSHYDIDDRDLYIDKVSGKDFDRPRYIVIEHPPPEGICLHLDAVSSHPIERE